MEIKHDSKLKSDDSYAAKPTDVQTSPWHKELADDRLLAVARNMSSSAADDLKCGLPSMKLCDGQSTVKMEDKAKAENLEQNDRPVYAVTKKNILEGVAKEIADTYTFPELAKNIQSQLLKDQSEGKFDGAATSIDFAKALTTELQTIGNDKHLAVNFYPEKIGHSDSDMPTESELKESLDFQKQIHSGITATKNGDIGSFKIDTFMPINDSKNPDGAAMTKKDIDDAMHSLSGVKTLMIDLRDNDGGLAETCLQVQSYIQPPGTHVNSIIWRNRNQDDQSLTWNEKQNGWEQKMKTTDVGGAKLFAPDTKIYVLTSPETFSAAEELAYDLQATGRATVVGQTTKGGANPGGYKKLGQGFHAFIPTGRSSNPYRNGGNWEHTGVKPDLETAEGEEAYQAALKQSLK